MTDEGKNTYVRFQTLRLSDLGETRKECPTRKQWWECYGNRWIMLSTRTTEAIVTTGAKNVWPIPTKLKPSVSIHFPNEIQLSL